MGRTKEQQREYMREYRARHRKPSPVVQAAWEVIADVHTDLRSAKARIAELEEEVRHLTAALTAADTWIRNHNSRSFSPPGFNTRPFTPVPKKGHA